MFPMIMLFRHIYHHAFVLHAQAFAFFCAVDPMIHLFSIRVTISTMVFICIIHNKATILTMFQRPSTQWRSIYLPSVAQHLFNMCKCNSCWNGHISYLIIHTCQQHVCISILQCIFTLLMRVFSYQDCSQTQRTWLRYSQGEVSHRSCY